MQCPICFEGVSFKVLPCLHVFCSDCLEHHCENENDGEEKPCPLCRQSYIIPPGGIKELRDYNIASNINTISASTCGLSSDDEPSAAAEYLCNECERYLCLKCEKYHNRLPATRNHCLVKIRSNEISMANLNPRHHNSGEYCNTHQNHPLEFYCHNCTEEICVTCVAGTHRLHETKDMVVMGKEIRAKMEKGIGCIVQLITGTQRDAKTDQDAMELLDGSARSVEVALRNYFWELQNFLNLNLDKQLELLNTLKTSAEKDLVSKLEREQDRLLKLEEFLNETVSLVNGNSDLAKIRAEENWQKMLENFQEPTEEMGPRMQLKYNPNSGAKQLVQYIMGNVYLEGSEVDGVILNREMQGATAAAAVPTSANAVAASIAPAAARPSTVSAAAAAPAGPGAITATTLKAPADANATTLKAATGGAATILKSFATGVPPNCNAVSYVAAAVFKELAAVSYAAAEAFKALAEDSPTSAAQSSTNPSNGTASESTLRSDGENDASVPGSLSLHCDDSEPSNPD